MIDLLGSQPPSLDPSFLFCCLLDAPDILHLHVIKSDHLYIIYVHVAAFNASPEEPLPSILANSRPIDDVLFASSPGQLDIANVNEAQLCISLQLSTGK